jgi:hypothetical protein
MQRSAIFMTRGASFFADFLMTKTLPIGISTLTVEILRIE